MEVEKMCSNPDFAVICSFIEQFGSKIDINLDIEQLEKSINDQENLDDSLIDLHVKLIRKTRKYFIRDHWQKFLIRFVAEYSYEDAYQIETLGYLKTHPSIKLELLRRLLDVQFECDQKFKAAVNLTDADQLRQLPLGRDIIGNTYWRCADNEGNFRLFREEPMKYDSWKQICSTRQELSLLLDELDKMDNLDDKSNESQIRIILEEILQRVESSIQLRLEPTKGDDDQVKPVTTTKKKRSVRDKPAEEAIPRRSSSRIQQLQMKKIAEEEEKMKKKMIELEEKKRNIPAASSISRDYQERPRNGAAIRECPPQQKSSDMVKKRKRRRNKKDKAKWKKSNGKKLPWDKDDSDLSSTSSEPSDDDDLDDMDISFGNHNLDDDFACEEEDGDGELVIVKRARTLRKSMTQDEYREDTVIEEDKPCRYCNGSNDPEWILLCDMCDDGYHTTCCTPPLMLVPDGNWYCPVCEHKMLLINLQSFYTHITGLRAAKEKQRTTTAKTINNRIKVEVKDEIVQMKDILEDDDITDDEFKADSDTSYSHDSPDIPESPETSDITETPESSETSETSSIDELVASPVAKNRKKRRRKRSDSYYSDESDDYQPMRSRRAASKIVSYKESTDEDDLDLLDGVKQKEKMLSSDEATVISDENEPDRLELDL